MKQAMTIHRYDTNIQGYGYHLLRALSKKLPDEEGEKAYVPAAAAVQPVVSSSCHPVLTGFPPSRSAQVQGARPSPETGRHQGR